MYTIFPGTLNRQTINRLPRTTRWILSDQLVCLVTPGLLKDYDPTGETLYFLAMQDTRQQVVIEIPRQHWESERLRQLLHETLVLEAFE